MKLEIKSCLFQKLIQNYIKWISSEFYKILCSIFNNLNESLCFSIKNIWRLKFELTSQSSPLNPESQAHSKLPAKLVQTLFWPQGESAHSSISRQDSPSPSNPSLHSQSKAPEPKMLIKNSDSVFKCHLFFITKILNTVPSHKMHTQNKLFSHNTPFCPNEDVLIMSRHSNLNQEFKIGQVSMIYFLINLN